MMNALWGGIIFVSLAVIGFFAIGVALLALEWLEKNLFK